MAKKFDELFSKMPLESQKKVIERSDKTIDSILLAEMRKVTGQTQSEVADKMGISQSALSQLENQEDMQISTLAKLVKALGGNIEIIAHLPQKDLRVGQFEGAQ